MSFKFPENKNENKAQWHFLQKKGQPDYDAEEGIITSDVLGSYTGTAYDDLDPVQDADDL